MLRKRNEAHQLLKSVVGQAHDYDSAFINLIPIYVDEAKAGMCPYCEAVSGEDCEDRVTIYGDPADYSGQHMERWYAICPELITILTEGLDWVIDDDREDRMLGALDPDRLPIDTPANVYEAFLILLRGVK
jgi:hypothetical protein